MVLRFHAVTINLFDKKMKKKQQQYNCITLSWNNTVWHYVEEPTENAAVWNLLNLFLLPFNIVTLVLYRAQEIAMDLGFSLAFHCCASWSNGDIRGHPWTSVDIRGHPWTPLSELGLPPMIFGK